MFKTGDRAGFSIKFGNGFTVSVVWHDFAYADRVRDSKLKTAKTAEVAIWKDESPSKQPWYIFEGGTLVRLDEGSDVMGWQTPEQVAEIIAAVAAAKG